MSVELILGDEYEFFNNIYSFMPTKNGVGLHTYIFRDRSLTDALEDLEGLSKAIEKEVLDCLEFDREPLFGPYEKRIDKIVEGDSQKWQKEFNAISKEMIDNIEWVRIAFTNKDSIKDFIFSNTLLLRKKVVLPDYLSITNLERAKELYDEYFVIRDCIYVNLENNSEYVKIEDAYNTILKIKEITDNTLKLGMSPAEQIMHAYDEVRKRIYKVEDEIEDQKVSRDLSEVLNDDNKNIVCTGYANIFSAILTGLNIKNNIVSLVINDNPNYGHSRVMAYIKDEKHDIDGVYYFDPTFDSQKENDTTNYINSYRFFAKTRTEIESLDNGKYTDELCPYYSKNLVSEIKELLDNEDYESLNEANLYKSLSYMTRFVLDQRFINRLTLLPISPTYGDIDETDIMCKVKAIQDKYNQPITAEKYVSILDNVRKKEYYQDPDKYPYTLNDLFETYRRSNWDFSKHYYSGYEIMCRELLNKEPNRNPDDEFAFDFINYTKKNEVDKEIGRVRLTKVLSLFNKNRK